MAVQEALDITQAVKEVVEWFDRTEKFRSGKELSVESGLLHRLKVWLQQMEQRDLDPNRKENEREERRFRKAWEEKGR
jgi:hypothetical protein